MGHDTYITQDGYDSGQLFVCNTCEKFWPVLGDDGKQTYEVTLEHHQRLVDDHHSTMGDPN